jgi:hypothetical protein
LKARTTTAHDEGGIMEIGLAHLIDKESASYVEESRTFNAAIDTASDQAAEPDPSTPEGLQAARNQLTSGPPDPRALEGVARAQGREVPVRIITPAQGHPRAVYLQIHGGGFFMGSATRSDTPNALLADAAGVAVVSVDYRLAPEHPWPAAPETGGQPVDGSSSLFSRQRGRSAGVSRFPSRLQLVPDEDGRNRPQGDRDMTG